MQATGDAGTLEGLVGSILAADGHETGHLNLGELNLAAAKGSQGLGRVSRWSDQTHWTEQRADTYDVGDLELLSGGSHCDY